ncbi:MAG TPA: YeeE/YedE thiosulfate transporter family protein [Vicinamibacteria bacterium]|nr:YeeE/YedE thiosulfate transporter family protein [Vicinamibacteria bacterium]
MRELLLERPAWYVIGILIGLVTVGLFAFINERVGVVGGYSSLVERATGRGRDLGWKAWFLFGVVGGALVFRLLAGSSTVGDGYGWLTRELGGHSYAAVGGSLFVAGMLVGFGAKYAAGCTSGNGIGGTSVGSPASFVATGTFMATAIAVSFAIKAVVG